MYKQVEAEAVQGQVVKASTQTCKFGHFFIKRKIQKPQKSQKMSVGEGRREESCEASGKVLKIRL